MANNSKTYDSSPSRRPESKLGQEEIWVQLAAQYLHDLPQQLDRIKTTVEVKDYTAIKKQAHRIKGTSGTYRLDTISEGIAQLDDGRLVIAEVGARRIVAITTDTDELEVIADNLPLGLPPFMGPPKTFLPTGVLVGEGGIIYVAADITHTVLKITPLK